MGGGRWVSLLRWDGAGREKNYGPKLVGVTRDKIRNAQRRSPMYTVFRRDRVGHAPIWRV